MWYHTVTVSRIHDCPSRNITTTMTVRYMINTKKVISENWGEAMDVARQEVEKEYGYKDWNATYHNCTIYPCIGEVKKAFRSFDAPLRVIEPDEDDRVPTTPPLRLEYIPKKLPKDSTLIVYVGSDELPARANDFTYVKEKLSSLGCKILIFPHNVLLYSAQKLDGDAIYVAFVGNKKWDASHFDDDFRETIERGVEGATGIATKVLLDGEIDEGE